MDSSNAPNQRCTRKRKSPEEPSEPGSSDEVQNLAPQTENFELETVAAQVRHRPVSLQEVPAQPRRARMMRTHMPGPPLPPGFRLAALACGADPRRNLHSYRTVRPSWDWATRVRTNSAFFDEGRTVIQARVWPNRVIYQEGDMMINNLDGEFAEADEHSDLRLNVDNMTHEELIALQEQVGNVNAGLTEEIIVERLRWREYQSTDKDDSCAICLENYVDGDELGLVDCRHKFHLVCVKDWLRVKNSCPVCKMTALAE